MVRDSNISDLSVIASWLVINACVGVVVIDEGDLHFQLHLQVRIIMVASDVLSMGRRAIDEGGGSVSS